jgi:3-oxoadipate enol-lactonase
MDLYYEERGDGPPLLFLPGLGRNLGSWATVTPYFERHWRCLVFDQRGTGRSSVPAGPYSIEQMADDASALLDTLAVDAATCVGVSMGASVLQSLASRHPARVSRAVLVSAFPNYSPVQHAWLDAILALRRAGVEPLASSIATMPWVFTPRVLASHADAARFAQLSLEDPYPTRPAGFEAQAAAVRAFDSLPGLSRVTAPTLVLVGAEDVLTPVEQSIQIAEAIPGAKLQVLARGGHAMVAEYPDDVVRAIRAFIRNS